MYSMMKKAFPGLMVTDLKAPADLLRTLTTSISSTLSSGITASGSKRKLEKMREDLF